MKSRAVLICAALTAMFPPLSGAGFPQADESLHYTVNWPSGLSLGEGRLEARHTGQQWEFEFVLDAAVPGFSVADRYRSVANADLCSEQFDKNTLHGRRKAAEKTVFDYRKGQARRSTVGGGKTEFPISGCEHDALDFLFFARKELAQGRLPSAQSVRMGAPYQVRLEYTGLQTVSVNEKKLQADRIVVYAKGPASTLSFEIFFSRDAARTPVMVRAPFSLGTFSMELAP